MENETKETKEVAKKVTKKVTVTDAYLKLKALPKMTIEKFETIEEIQTIINVCNEVINGKIENQIKQAKDKYDSLIQLQNKLKENA